MQRLPLLGQAHDLRGHPAEHDLAAAGSTHRPGTGAIDRRPDDLRRDLGRRPWRRVEVGPRHRPDVDAETVCRPDAAAEALGEALAAEMDMRGRSLLCLGERRRRRRVERRTRGPGLGDERLAVEQAHETVLADDGERPVERRGQAKRHLGRPVDERSEPARRVAPVPRLDRDRGSGAR